MFAQMINVLIELNPSQENERLFFRSFVRKQGAKVKTIFQRRISAKIGMSRPFYTSHSGHLGVNN